MRYRKLGLLLGLLILSGCDYYDDRLQVKNETRRIIAIETYLSDVPDTSATNNTEYYLSNTIAPNEVERFTQMGSTKGWLFRIKKSTNNKLNLFVFDADSLKEYGINSLIVKGIYDRYILSESELESMNWQVVVK